MSNNQRRAPPGFLNRSSVSIPNQAAAPAPPDLPAPQAHHQVNRSMTVPQSSEYNYSQLNESTISADHVNTSQTLPRRPLSRNNSGAQGAQATGSLDQMIQMSMQLKLSNIEEDSKVMEEAIH